MQLPYKSKIYQSMIDAKLKGSVSERRLSETSEHVNPEIQEAGFFISEWEVCQTGKSQKRYWPAPHFSGLMSHSKTGSFPHFRINILRVFI